MPFMNPPFPGATSEWMWLGLNADNWIAIGSALVAVVSVFAAVRAVKDARRSADAAEKSATEAATLSKIEGERRKDEREETHRSLQPTQQNVITASLKGPPGGRNLYGDIEVDRETRVQAEAILTTGATTPLAQPADRAAAQSCPRVPHRAVAGGQEDPTDRRGPVQVLASGPADRRR